MNPESEHSTGCGEHEDGLEARLVRLGDDWATAIVANDAKRIASFMSEDWVMVSESGISPRQQFLDLVESGALTHSTMHRVGAARVRVHGRTAVLSARVTNRAHHAGRQYDADEWTTDVFAERDGRWLCVLSQVTPAAEGD